MEMIMKLYITADSDIEMLRFESISIAGKGIVEYWLEWARHKGYNELIIYSDKISIEDIKVQTLENLYGVKLSIKHLSDKKDSASDDAENRGIGIFLDSGKYRCFNSLDELLSLEQELIYTPLNYSSSVGYGKSEHIYIGKNVYIHKSVKLLGAVVIGDNCTIEEGVEIKDSVINEGCHIKNGSTLQNSHISKNIHMTTNLYLRDKALFESSIYDIAKQSSLAHEGICLKKE
jgi:NDP-sugar pyrophosphorylase family protein